MSARRTFGATWWGQAWLDALEGRAVHDPNRLPRGRTYARHGRARDLTIEPGRVQGAVRGSGLETYDVVLEIRRFRDDEWEWVLDAIAAKAAHAAALLDGELDPGIVADARQAEVEILPRSGELRTGCTCPDWAEPCKHAAAVCYLMADAIDDDPFVVFLLRGLDRSGVLDGIRARRVASAASGPTRPPPLAEPGEVAREAWARPAQPLPPPPAPPARHGRPAPWPTDPPAMAEFDAASLHLLALDAARRAWEVRTGRADSALVLDAASDAARRAVAHRATERRALADRAGLTEAQLEARAAAWVVAGVAGVRALDEAPWNPPVAEMASARDALLAAGVPPAALQVRSNRLTVGGSEQYLRARDGFWYRFSKESGRWSMTAGPAAEVDELVDADVPPM